MSDKRRFVAGPNAIYSIEVITDGHCKNLEQLIGDAKIHAFMASFPGIKEIRIALGGETFDSSVENEYLKPLDIRHTKTIKLSGDRLKLAEQIAAEIRSYGSSRSETSLVICLYGPPGMGKSTLLRDIAIRSGRKAFIPVGVQSKYVGETSKAIDSIFEYVRKRNGILLWDEIEAAISARSTRDSDKAEEKLDTIGTLLRQLDQPGAVLLCSTNFPDVIDPAIRSRIQRNSHEMPDLTRDERHDYLKSIAPSLSETERNEVLDASIWCSFRDLDNFVSKLDASEFIPLKPRIHNAWEKSFRRRLSDKKDFTWTKLLRCDSDTQSPALQILCAGGRHVIINFESGLSLTLEVLPNGSLRSYRQKNYRYPIRRMDIHSATRQVLFCTDIGTHIDPDPRHARIVGPITIPLAEIFKRLLYGPLYPLLDQSNQSRAAAFAPGSTDIFFSLNGTSLSDYRSELHAHKINPDRVESLSKITLPFFASDMSVLSAKSTLTRIGCLASGARFTIVEFDHESSTFAVLETFSIGGNMVGHQRFDAAILSDCLYIGNLRKDGVTIHQLAFEGAPNPQHIGFFSTDNPPSAFAIDKSSGKLAIVSENQLTIWNTLTDPLSETTSLDIPVPDVTALAFTNFGQALVLGSAQGKILCTSLRKPRTGIR